MIKTLKDINQEAIFLGIFMLAIAFLTIFQTIFSSINIFYFAKDINYILPLPLKPYEILLSKFNVLIITEYVTEFVFALAPFIIYGVLTGAGAMFYVYGLLVLLLFPILPAIIATILVMIIMTFSKFSKNKDRFRLIGGLIGIFIAIGAQFIAQRNTEISTEGVINLFMKANGLVEMLESYFITLKPAVETLINANNIQALSSFVELFLISLASLIVFVLIGQKLYFRGVVGSGVTASGKSKKVSDTEYKAKRVSIRYIGKEIKILCRNPIYFMQCVLPSLLIPVMFTVIFAVNPGTKQLIDMISGISPYSPYIVCGIIALIEFYSMMSFVAITAISRDGENAIFTKYVPISLYKQFLYKIIPGIIFNIIPALFIVIAIYFIFPNTSIVYGIIMFIIAMVLNVLQNYLMFMVDLKRPKLSWDSEYAVVKQNMNMIFEFIFAFVVMGILVGIAILLRNIDFRVSMVVIAVLLLISTVLVDRYVYKKQNELFEKIQ